MTKVLLCLIITEVATFVHACEGDAVTKLSQEKIPYFNAPIYLENKTQIGKVDEIFGPINESVCVPLSMRLSSIASLLTCTKEYWFLFCSCFLSR